MKRLGKSLWIAVLALIGALCLVFGACAKSEVTFEFVTEGDPIESVTVAVGTDYTLPVPERTGYSFGGWFLDAEYAGDAVATVKAEKDTTFYAKWTALPKITLQLGGGTLSESELYLDAGQNVYEFMKDRVPTRSGFQFGEWLNGTAPLAQTATMPAGGLTLTAHWKVQYTVHVFAQKLGTGNTVTDEYEAADDVVGYAYVTAEAFSPEAPHGFTVAEHEGSTVSKVLTETPSENVFTLYCDREQYTIYFNPNYPSSSGGEIKEVACYYGASVEAPHDVTANGYLLAGWSDSVNGSVIYDADAAAYFVRNGEEPAPDAIEADATMVLYAVWSPAYTDMFGSGDRIYHLAPDAEEIYLERGSVYFKGNYDVGQKDFYFRTGNNKTFSGKIFEDGTFVYYDETLEGSRSLYRVGTGADSSVTLSFDGYNGVTYTDLASGNTAEGSFKLDGSYFLVTYTEATGNLQSMLNREWTYLVGTVSLNGVSQAVFQIRDETEVGWGALYRLAMNDGTLGLYNSSNVALYSLTLNGFGTAAYRTSSGSSNYFYTREGDVITLLNSSNPQDVAGTFYHMVWSGYDGYMPYSPDFDNTFAGPDGSSLELDGLYTAKLYDASGAAVLEGVYALSSSVFGTVATVTAGGSARVFLLTSRTGTEIGGAEAETVYSYRERLPGYAEYHYYDEASYGGYYYAPLLILDETEAGKASLYGYTAVRTYEKVAEGTYTEQEGGYLFTVTDPVQDAATVLDTPVDLTKVRSFVFDIGYAYSNSSVYPVMYWTAVVTDGGTETGDRAVVYTNSDGEAGGTLTVVGGFAIYQEKDGEPVVGSYRSETPYEGSNVTSLYAYINGSVTTYYFHLDGSTKKFTVLETPIGRMREMAADRSFGEDYLYVDGKGIAHYLTPNEDGTDTVDHKGTYRATDQEPSHFLPEGSALALIYHFEEDGGDGINFDYMIISGNSTVYFAKVSETKGDYTQEAGGARETLRLDGVSNYASYTDSANLTYTGSYRINDDGIVVFAVSQIGDAGAHGEVFYFKVTEEGKTFSRLGDEYAYYLFDDNGYIYEYYLKLEGVADEQAAGRKKLTVYQFADDDAQDDADVENAERTAVGSGTYAVNGDGTYDITYTVGAKTVHCTGVLGTLTISDVVCNVLFKVNELTVTTYVIEEDMSVLVLDDHSGAVLHDMNGNVVAGRYMLITDDLLYFANEEGTDASLYRYDTAKSTVTPVENTPRAFYTGDLRALLFTEYGFMEMDGETRYYYSIGEGGSVTLYRHDPEGEGANDYGFVVSELESKITDKTLTVDGTVYTLNEGGIGITFVRAEADKENYKIKLLPTWEEPHSLEMLSFNPRGSATFTVSCTLTINGQSATGTVVREKVEGSDTEYELYVRLNVSGDAGYYRWDITPVYDGENSTFTVTGLTHVTQLLSANYLYNYYMYFVYYGVSIGNSFGVITVTETYGAAEAEPVSKTVNGEFSVNSDLYDSNGKLIKLEDAQYTYDGQTGLYTLVLQKEAEGTEEEGVNYGAVTDDYTYTLRFGISSQFLRTFGLYSYVVLAFTREQVLTTGSGEDAYTVVVERTIVGETANFSSGGVYSVMLYHGTDATEANLLEADRVYVSNGLLYYFVVTRDEAEGEAAGKVRTSVRYTIRLVEKEASVPEGGGSDLGEEEEEGTEGEGNLDADPADLLPVYEQVTVEKQELTVLYDESGLVFIEYYKDADQTVHIVHLNRGGTNLLVFECNAVAGQANTYSILTSNGRKFTVTIGENATVHEEV